MGHHLSNGSVQSVLQDKNVLIFGGTSGIGLAAAKQAKDAGAQVTVVGLKPERARQIASEYGFDGWRATDVTRSETIAEALTGIGQVDHLVLLAGSFVTGKVSEADVAHLRRAFDERVWAAIHILRALGNRLAPNGSITFVSGALSDRPNAYGTAVLAAACASMEALARGLALELAPVRVNTLSPGPIETPLLTKALGENHDTVVNSMIETLPLHRLGTVTEAGAAIVFLMTNGWMNGATLNVDGGARLV
jgi:NAD(P)-dependent dehydrogenase (short-subunit alcohol dehydrogenase family)